MNTVSQRLVRNLAEYLDAALDITVVRGDVNDAKGLPQVAVALRDVYRTPNMPGHYEATIDCILSVSPYDDEGNEEQDTYEDALETALTDTMVYEVVNDGTVYLYEIYIDGTSLDYTDNINHITLTCRCIFRSTS